MNPEFITVMMGGFAQKTRTSQESSQTVIADICIMSKWKTTEARTSCVLDLCFQLYSNLLPLITPTCTEEIQIGLGLCSPWCNTKTQETFFCLGCICRDPWTLAAAWSLVYSLDKSMPEPEVLDFWLQSTTIQCTMTNSGGTRFSLRTDL